MKTGNTFKVRLLWFVVIIPLTFAGCSKTNNVESNVLFYNASWSLPGLTASLNNNPVDTIAIAPGQSTGRPDSPYLKLPAGLNLLKVNSGPRLLLSNNFYTTATGGNSLFFFDSSPFVSSIYVSVLTDDLSLPDTMQLKYRILDYVPDTSVKTDIWLVQGADSLLIDSAHSFLMPTFGTSSLQSFAVRSYHGGAYTIKFKKTGTEELYAYVPDYPFAIRGIYSIVFSGLPAGSGNAALQLKVLRHPPS